MSLLFDAQVASRNFDVQIEVEDGTHVAVLGRNGSGKSTLLSILAGVLRPDSGRAFLGDKMLFDIPKWTAPHTRGVSLLSQEPLLFPHKTVAQNTAFGPLAKHVPRGEAARLASHWLDEVGYGRDPAHDHVRRLREALDCWRQFKIDHLVGQNSVEINSPRC